MENKDFHVLTTPSHATAAAPDSSAAPAPLAGPGFSRQLQAILGEWGRENADFLAALEHRMRGVAGSKPLPENALWELIADSWSADWAGARARLGEAAADLHERMKPENVPLGAIGLALDAGELGKAEKRYGDALVAFTVINEELRQNEHLSHLLQTLSQIAETVDQSMEASAQVQNLNASFKVAEKPQPKAAAQARPKPEKKGFRAYVDLIFGGRKAQEAPQPAVAAIRAEKPAAVLKTPPTL